MDDTRGEQEIADFLSWRDAQRPESLAHAVLGRYLDRIVRSTTFLLSPAILHELEALVDEQALGSRIREISLEFAGFVRDRAFRFAQRKYDDVFNEDYYLVRSYPLLDNERGMYENFVTGAIEKLIEDKVDEAKGVMRDYMGYVSYDNSTIFSSSSESEQE